MPDYCQEALNQVDKLMKTKSFNRNSATIQREFELAAHNIKIETPEVTKSGGDNELVVNSMDAAKLIFEEDNEESTD